MFSPLLTIFVPGLRMGGGNNVPPDVGTGEARGDRRRLRYEERRADEEKDLVAVIACLELLGAFD